MKITEKPKGMKDPVLIMGKWEERVPPWPTAGKTKANMETADKEHLEAVKGITRATKAEVEAQKKYVESFVTRKSK